MIDGLSARYLSLLDVASNIEEISWLATVQFDDVHGGHGQTCPIHKAPNIPVHLHGEKFGQGIFECFPGDKKLNSQKYRNLYFHFQTTQLTSLI